MKLKKLFFISFIGIFCFASKPGTLINTIMVPDEVGEITISPRNNNNQYIEYRTHTGELIAPDPSWKKKILVNDQTLLKHIKQEEQPTITQKQSTVTLVNNNEHVIIQNNTQSQTVVSEQKKEMPATPPNLSWYVLLLNAINNNKGKIFIGSLALGWITVASKLYYDAYSIAKNDGWGNWNAHLSIDNLLHNDHATMAQQLFTEIQKKYMVTSGNFLTPLINFMNDVETELAYLKKFLRIHEILNAYNFSFIFPQQIEIQSLAFKKIQRLELLKSLVVSFAAEYKVSN